MEICCLNADYPFLWLFPLALSGQVEQRFNLVDCFFLGKMLLVFGCVFPKIVLFFSYVWRIGERKCLLKLKILKALLLLKIS